jgi:ribose/xylose/arabinose/galactoside ABC-type transport system permease subunit
MVSSPPSAPATSGMDPRPARRLSGLDSDLVLSLSIMLVFSVISALLIPHFLEPSNLENILRIYSPSGIMALGLALVLLSGEIDVSVGSIMSLSVMVGSIVLKQNELLAIPVMIVVGALCGLVNGILVTRLKVPSLIVTLGMISVYAGLAAIVVNSQGTFFNDAYPQFTIPARGDILGIPTSFMICLLVAVFGWWLSRRTRYGRDLYFTGANRRSAWMSGVHIDNVRILAFVVCGATAGLGGYLTFAHIGGSSAEIGVGHEMTAIAIAVLGGVSLFGGKGSVLSVLIGMVTMGVFLNMLALSKLGSYFILAMQGVLVIVVVILFGLMERWSRGRMSA